MLCNDPKRMRFLGIDIRPRGRRRWLLVFIYLIYAEIKGSAANHEFSHPHAVVWAASAYMIFFGIFGLRGPVKSFDEVGSFSFDGLRAQLQKEFFNTRLGKYLNGSIDNLASDKPDERELPERTRASYLTLNFMTLMFIVKAFDLSMGSQHFKPEDPIASALFYAVLALTVPKAIILWTEPDPRDHGEIELVHKEA